MTWSQSYRADPGARALADRHYNRQKVGAAQFVPPGRCLVLRRVEPSGEALWVTSWPFAQYVKHDWAGAWVNSLFRNEGAGLSSDLIRAALSSDLIRAAVAATRFQWDPPALGIVTFVDPRAVPGVMVRGVRIYGFAYLKAGFRHVGFTKAGLWAWQMEPAAMPEPHPALGPQPSLFEDVA